MRFDLGVTWEGRTRIPDQGRFLDVLIRGLSPGDFDPPVLYVAMTAFAARSDIGDNNDRAGILVYRDP